MSKPLTPEQLARPNTEDAHQMALFAQAALHREKYPQLEWMHAIPNGGSRNLAEAAKLVGTGTRAGVFDVFLPYPIWQGEYNPKPIAGLYIEMKQSARRNHKNSGLTDDQIKFMTYATVAGYKCVVCYTWIEAWNEIVKYLNGE